MNLKKTILSIAAFSSISLHAIAGTIVFQQGVDDYEGFQQVNLYGDGSQTANHSNNEILWAWGTPTAGWKKMFIIRFDDIFDPLKGGLSEDMIVTSAHLELYKVNQLDSSDWLWDNTSANEQQVRMYEMTSDVNREPAGYATFTYRNYIDASNNSHWLDTLGNPSTQGPRSGVDWSADPRIGTIQMEKGASDKWYSLDITDVVNSNRELDGTAGKGFFFRASSSWMGLDFASGTYLDTEYRPRLVLEYTVVPEPKSFALMGVAAFTLLAFGRRKAKATCDSVRNH